MLLKWNLYIELDKYHKSIKKKKNNIDTITSFQKRIRILFADIHT